MSKNNRIKIELNPEMMFASITENNYKIELELLDRYIKFSSELLRLSLLCVAVVGFIITNYNSVFQDNSGQAEYFLIAGILSFAFSSMLAMIHRYIATDAFRFFCYGIRLKESAKETIDQMMDDNIEEALKSRKIRLNFGPYMKGFSAIFLVVGAISISIAFITLL
jgi:hypothetical protein